MNQPAHDKAAGLCCSHMRASRDWMLLAANHTRVPGALSAGSLAPPQAQTHMCRGGWIALSVARALHFLHANGVAHLGVSPDCVLLADDGTAVLGDLGAARLLGPHTRAADPARPCCFSPVSSHPSGPHLDSRHPDAQQVGLAAVSGAWTCGRLPRRCGPMSSCAASRSVRVKQAATQAAGVRGAEWMAPELLPCASVSERADVWSFGVLLWHLCTGHPPEPNMACSLECAQTRPFCSNG